MKAIDIINRAFGITTILAKGETLSADDAQGGLDILNDFVDMCNIERLLIPTVQETVVSIAPNTKSLTVGPTGDIVADRPVQLENKIYFRFNNIDYQSELINREQYESLTLKTLTSLYPTHVYYDANYPIGTMYFFPQSNVTLEMHLPMQKQLTQFDDLTTEYNFPPGYKQFFVWNLARLICADYGVPMTSEIIKHSDTTKAMVKRQNRQHGVLDMPTALMGRPQRFNVYSGLNE